MALNRKSYTSLIESVNESVSTDMSAGSIKPFKISSKVPKSTKVKKGDPFVTYKPTKPTIAEEEWDVVDDILAEGLELYGEDGLAEILTDYAETGKISEKLALLLSDK